jgi:hypothetical protein
MKLFPDHETHITKRSGGPLSGAEYATYRSIGSGITLLRAVLRIRDMNVQTQGDKLRGQRLASFGSAVTSLVVSAWDPSRDIS